MIIPILIGCFSFAGLTNKNFAYLYEVAPVKERIQYNLYHHNDSTIIYALIPYNNLSFELNDLRKMQSAFFVRVNIRRSFQEMEILDSIIIPKEHIRIKDKNSLIAELNFPNSFVGKALLELYFYDKYGGKKQVDFISIDKSSRYVRQNFLTKTLNDEIIFNNNFSENRRIKLNYNDENKKRLYVRYYNKRFRPALPPFLNVLPKPAYKLAWDSTFIYNVSDTLRFSKKGIYHFHADSLVFDGFTIFVYDKEYPKIADIDQLIEALRYISKNEEYKRMVSAENKKKEVDNFWLNIGGSPDRTRVLIKTYYNRVEFANKYFSSYKEGWKTDRGIIYVVFGEPDIVNKKDELEVWTYDQNQDRAGVEFEFEQTNNPFSDNDYFLRRDVYFDSPWHLAVQLWRQGRIVN